MKEAESLQYDVPPAGVKLNFELKRNKKEEPKIMKKIKSIVFLCFIFILLNSPLSAQAWRGMARVSGVVLTEEGKPIPNAKVIFSSPSIGARFEITTDKEGKWVTSGIRGGAWDIDFLAEGYETKKIVTQVSELQRGKPIEIRLQRSPYAVAVEKLSFLIKKGNELFEQKNYPEALKEYKEILDKNPDLYQIHRNIGNCYYETGDYDSALEHYLIVFEREPLSAEIIVSIGTIYIAKRDVDKALEYFNKIDEKSITSPLVFYNLGILLFKKGETDKAIEYHKKALSLDPKNADIYYQLGLCYLQKNAKEMAKESFTKFLELAPGSPNVSNAKEFLKYLEKK